MLKIENYKHPLHFYLLATIIPWSFWSLAGYLSHQPTSNQLRQQSDTDCSVDDFCFLDSLEREGIFFR